MVAAANIRLHIQLHQPVPIQKIKHKIMEALLIQPTAYLSGDDIYADCLCDSGFHRHQKHINWPRIDQLNDISQ